PAYGQSHTFEISQAKSLSACLNEYAIAGAVITLRPRRQWAGLDHPPAYLRRMLENFVVTSQSHFTKWDLVFFFKYYDEYYAAARPEGRTIVFGGSWTFGGPPKSAATSKHESPETSMAK
ncbi:MAG: hypothetical protein WCD60_15930, partial [Pseudolabrys sp.]